MSSDAPAGKAVRASYKVARAAARRIGVGRMRARVQSRVHKSKLWTAVPPLRLKDLDARGGLPPGAVALTYDDGPDPIVTPMLLRLLEEHSAHATFFMCGEAAKRHPDLVRAVVAAGHGIGGHSWDHRHKMLRGLPEAEWRRQVDDTHALLADVAGRPVRWFRPPRGIIDRYTWTRLRRQGLSTMLWSIDGWDCALRDPDEIAARVVGAISAGEIALLHDANANYLFSASRSPYGQPGNQESTVRATELILRNVRERDLIPVSVDLVPHQVMPRTGRPRIRRG
jgi:peptidoglycan/xylan/chitin deacetylase (PgdA/CDA1 family)